MAKGFFSEQEQASIVEAIKEAETNTSGEIVVHVENHCKGEPMDRSIALFEKLGMGKTELKNGVLVYLAVKDHKFAIIGDTGINSIVPDHFWDDIKEAMLQKFKEGRYAEGLCQAIRRSGEQLKLHFPFKSDDQNELSDDISFGDN